jgi:copper(I)-binding protein
VNAEPVIVRRIGLGLAVAVALLSTACAAGKQAGTANEQASLDGVNRTLGSIALRGLAVEAPEATSYPAGSTAQLKLVIVNTGTSDDKLTSITTPSATGWAAYRTTAAADRAIAADQSGSAPAEQSSSAPASAPAASGSDTGSASGSESAPSSSAAPAPRVPQPLSSVRLPAGGRVSWGVPEAKGALLLLGTQGTLYPGTTIRVTFTFDQAGSITISVPIQLTSSPGTSVIPGPSATGQDG